MISGRVGRIREGSYLRFNEGVVEHDASEEMFSGAWDPRFGNEATCHECSQVTGYV